MFGYVWTLKKHVIVPHKHLIANLKSHGINGDVYVLG